MQKILEGLIFWHLGVCVYDNNQAAYKTIICFFSQNNLFSNVSLFTCALNA